MNNHQKWQAAKNDIKTKCGTMSQTQLIEWFNSDIDDTCVRITIYQYLYDNFEKPFN
jgi:hypothetical protein